MDTEYDLVVVGTGVAASGIATTVRRAGWRVAVIDSRPFGGTCALRGCDPKKVLVGAAEALDRVRRLRGRGLAGDASIEWTQLIAFKRTFTDPVPREREKSLAEQGIDAFHGRARFVGRDSIAAGDIVLHARRFVIASGAEPVALGIPGEEHLASSEQFMALERLPQRIVFVGGGYIASELSNIAARAGARVTVLQRGRRLLSRFDADLVGWLMESFRAAGIEVRTEAAVEAIEKGDQGGRDASGARHVAGARDASDGGASLAFRVLASSPQGRMSVGADLVVHAAGRVPALQALALSEAAVSTKDGRIELNDFLQSTSNPAVYAAGDSAERGPPLTPVASYDAQVVATNLLEGNRVKASYAGVPSVAFTIPPIASVGLSEEKARAQGYRFRTNVQRASGWYTARRLGEPVYGFKTLVEEGSGRILGAHLVGPGAEETINLFALAIRHGLTARQLTETRLAYPTAASDIAYML